MLDRARLIWKALPYVPSLYQKRKAVSIGLRTNCFLTGFLSDFGPFISKSLNWMQYMPVASKLGQNKFTLSMLNLGVYLQLSHLSLGVHCLVTR